jgi:hypothetical protein
MQRGFVIVLVDLGIVAFAIVAAGLWIFSPSHAFYVREDSTIVRLIADTPAVRGLITVEERNGPDEVRVGEMSLIQYGPMTAMAERRHHADKYFPQHVKFLSEMAHQPSVRAPNGSYVRVLDRSHAKCEEDPSLSAEYARVRITSGSLRGSEGWLCYWKDITPSIALP